MKTQATLTLPMLPQQSLIALERAVAQRFRWRIRAGEAAEQPRFVIEKQVRYDLIRGWPMVAAYRITGRFEKNRQGETTLTYVVSGDAGPPFFQAALLIGVLVVFTVVLGDLVFSPAIAGNPVGILLLGVMVFSVAAYGVLAVRSYQRHLREMVEFIEGFATPENNSGTD